MDTSKISIERAHPVGGKSNDKEKAIIAQFSFYKDEKIILIIFKKLNGTKMSIFEDFSSQETMQIRKEKYKEVLANRKQSKISYLQYRNVICKEGRTPA